MPEVLQVEKRDWAGKRRVRRQRAAGNIPAVLYGHGEEVVHLSVAASDIAAVMRHGSHVVELAGAVKQSALIKDTQWDTYGHDLLHIDFTRVSAGERVELAVAIELRGEAPGTKEGGVVEQVVRDVAIDCPATAVPSGLTANINQLHLGETITAGDLELPEGAKLQVEADLVIVQCVEPTAELDEDDADRGAAEPEVIGRKEEEGEEG